MNTIAEYNVRLAASSQAWMGREALRQLDAAARLDDVQLAAGFPNLHPGRAAPIGAAFVTQQVIYPHLIGGDIGCGMALFKTGLARNDARLEHWAGLPFNLERPWDQFADEFLASHGLESTQFDPALGTLGDGNHFAELQAIEQVFDDDAFHSLGLSRGQLVALVHSGSRGLGESVLRGHAVQHFEAGVDVDSSGAQTYLDGHDFALRWARASRQLIARRFAAGLGAQAELLWDACHNSVTKHGENGDAVYIHRRGAIPSDGPFAVIAGTRGSFSYLVEPLGENSSHAWSLAAGAGRKWPRAESRLRMRERFEPQHLTHTGLGGRVICEERDLLYEEAPDAYKDIETVVEDLVAAGLVSVVATLRPLLTYKTRKLRR